MTAEEVLARVRAANPGGRYARTASGYSVGEWVESRGRFVAIFCSSEWNGVRKWTCMIEGGMIREILVNGAPAYSATDWIE